MAFLRPSGGWRAGLLALFCGVVLATGRAAVPSPEYQVKAVFLFHFAQFVDWPAESFADDRAPIVIAIVGEDPFGDYLDALVQGEKIGDRTLEVRRFASCEQVRGGHIAFISRSVAAQLEPAVAGLRQAHVLTVGDYDGFLRAGGVVRFVTEKGKIHLRISVDAAGAAGLRLSSKLLRASTVVPAAELRP